MKHSEFTIGLEFYCGGGQYRCTDVGTRTIAAIRIDRVEISSTDGPNVFLSREEAEPVGWFNGPTYAVAETLFDEDDMPVCFLTPRDA